jgi:hypothetical protein
VLSPVSSTIERLADSTRQIVTTVRLLGEGKIEGMGSTEASMPLSPLPWWVKPLRVVFIGVASLLAALVSGILLLTWSCDPPSLATLQSRFPRQRRDLETIISMSDRDAQFIRIDPDWLQTREREFHEYSPETGITQERWDEYRRLFARNGITQGIQRDPESKDAFILVKSVGLLNRGYSNGYLYCGPGRSTGIRRAPLRSLLESILTAVATKPTPTGNWLTVGTRTARDPAPAKVGWRRIAVETSRLHSLSQP